MGLWDRASVEPGDQARMNYYYEGLEQYRRAKELYPTSAYLTGQYGQALLKLGNQLINARRTDEGAPLRRKGRELVREAELLDRWDELTA